MVNHNRMSIYIFAPIIVLAFYSFGTFSFFNLFGLAQLVKAIVILFCILGIIAIFEMNVITRYPLFSSLIILFFSYYGFMLSIILGDLLYGIVQGMVMVVCSLYLLGVGNKRLESITKGILLITGVSSLLGGLVFVLYAVYPSLLNPDSFFIASSVVGNNDIIAASILDYLSFTSGDGFEFFGNVVTRVKGYSNEPSSTIVHYLAPAGFAFFYYRKYRLLGIIILLFSLICISSLIGIIAIALSFLVYFILSIKNETVKKIIFIVGVGSIMIVMMNDDYLVSSLLSIGSDIRDYASYDLLARKEGSAYGRLSSYSSGFYQILRNPFGGSSEATMTALWIQIGLVGGIFMIFIFFIYSLKLLHLAIVAYKNTSSSHKKYGISLLLSISIVAFTISSYGWDRIPGVIMFILFYRIIQVEHEKMIAINKDQYVL